MKLERSKAVSLFEALGFPAAGKWDRKRMNKKVAGLPALVKSMESEQAVELGDADLDEVLGQIVAAVEAEEGIELLRDDQVAASDKAPNDEDKVDEALEPDEPADESVEEATDAVVTEPVEEAPKDEKAKKVKKVKAKAADKGTSNKERVFRLWEASDDKTAALAETFQKEAEAEVKLSTIKAWINQWNGGKNLPACAKSTT